MMRVITVTLSAAAPKLWTPSSVWSGIRQRILEDNLRESLIPSIQLSKIALYK